MNYVQPLNPEQAFMDNEYRSIIHRALYSLTIHEMRCVVRYYGLCGYTKMTHKAIAEDLGYKALHVPRIHINKAMRKLRNPRKRDYLRDYRDYELHSALGGLWVSFP